MPDASDGDSFLHGARLLRFEALQRRLVPRSATFTDSERAASRALVNDFVARQPAATARKLALFLFVIDVLAFVRGMRPFRNLPPPSQDALLARLFDARVPLLRKGFWGLNTVAKLGVYGQPSLHGEIGYKLRPNPADAELAHGR
jgi:hypothetical protein